MPWFDVTIRIDEDEARRYAIEAEDRNAAERVALYTMPTPDVIAYSLEDAPDDDDPSFDAVIPA